MSGAVPRYPALTRSPPPILFPCVEIYLMRIIYTGIQLKPTVQMESEAKYDVRALLEAHAVSVFHKVLSLRVLRHSSLYV